MRALLILSAVLAASEADAQRASLALRDRSVCGNNAIDGVPAEQIKCAPCPPGRPCRCDGVSRSEECDGDDLGGSTCVSRGHLGGRLRCTKRCTLDERACRSPRPKAVKAAGAVSLVAGAYVGGLAVVSSGQMVGAAWIANPQTPEAYFARFDRKLKPLDKPRSLGAFDRIGMVAWKKAWLAATSAGTRTTIRAIAADGTPGSEIATIEGDAVEFLAQRGDKILLGLRHSDGGLVGLRAVLLDGEGKPGTMAEVFGATRRDQVISVAPIEDGWLVLREADGSSEWASVDGSGKVSALPSPSIAGAQTMRLVTTKKGVAIVYVDSSGLSTMAVDATFKVDDAPVLLLNGMNRLVGPADAAIVIAQSSSVVAEEGPRILYLLRDGSVTPVRQPPAADVLQVFWVGARPVLAWTTVRTELVLGLW